MDHYKFVGLVWGILFGGRRGNTKKLKNLLQLNDGYKKKAKQYNLFLLISGPVPFTSGPRVVFCTYSPTILPKIWKFQKFFKLAVLNQLSEPKTTKY